MLYSAERTQEDTLPIERGVQGRVVGDGKSDQDMKKLRMASLSQNEPFLLLELKDCVGVREYETRLAPQSYSACEGEAKQGSGLHWERYH